jgi:hypothetical protein
MRCPFVERYCLTYIAQRNTLKLELQAQHDYGNRPGRRAQPVPEIEVFERVRAGSAARRQAGAEQEAKP